MKLCEWHKKISMKCRVQCALQPNISFLILVTITIFSQFSLNFAVRVHLQECSLPDVGKTTLHQALKPSNCLIQKKDDSVSPRYVHLCLLNTSKCFKRVSHPHTINQSITISNNTRLALSHARYQVCTLPPRPVHLLSTLIINISLSSVHWCTVYVGEACATCIYLFCWQRPKQLFRGIDSFLKNPRRSLGTLILVTAFGVWPDQILSDPCTIHTHTHILWFPLPAQSVWVSVRNQ